MLEIVLKLPAMYADHHVVEVRRILFATPGIIDVYASSSFQVAEIKYDEEQLSAEAIEAVLNDSGYLGDMLMPVEVGKTENGDKPYFRHSVAAAQVTDYVSFAQQTPSTGRPLWPCPGMGVIKQHQKEEELNG